ncbi:MAG: fructosamine kinase family protein [Balneolaceae bacterium]|nr:fructosamine kinase family protein [Balneolaceae bacterium]
MLPESIHTILSEKYSLSIHSSRSVSGGSINQAYKLSTNRGELFLKWKQHSPSDFFEREAEGLKELKSANGSLRIPDVIAVEKSSTHHPGFLLLEFIEEGRGGDSHQFGAELARLHQTKGDYFGLHYDNYIGSLPQRNGQYDNWISFFVEKRINIQIKMGVDSGKLSASVVQSWKRLASKLDNIFPPCKPSLLHGDLWGGNYLFDTSGLAVLIDPAVYYGHPEVDLAFTKMFGGFSRDFYNGYQSVSPIEGGFDERVPIFNLYPLLVHVNLFGGHYASKFQSLIKKY